MSKNGKPVTDGTGQALDMALAFLAEIEGFGNRFMPRQILDWDQRIQAIKDAAAGKLSTADVTDAQV